MAEETWSDDDELWQDGGLDADGELPEPESETAAKTRMTPRELVLVLVALVALAAAFVGFALYAKDAVPSDAAAKVNSTYILEEDVASWIAQYRGSSSITGDSDFADMLTSSGMTVSDFRIYAINQLVASVLIEQRAEELGLEVSDEEAQAELEEAKAYYASDDEDAWQELLESAELTEDELLEQYRVNLLEEALYEADVAVPDPTDDDLVSYIQTYLADSTQKHAYRIMFTGDDAEERAQDCLDELEALDKADELNLDAFTNLAIELSDEEDVESTGGSYAWSGTYMDDDAKEVIEDVSALSVSEAVEIEADDAIEIFYVDQSYTFGSYSSIEEVPDDVPDELLEEIEDATANYLWSADCTDYLTDMLAEAQVTYYPVPADAVYNVSLTDYDEE